MAKGTCGSGCPAECGCKSSTNACVAPWLGDAVASDGGVGGVGNGGSGGNGVGDGGGKTSGCSCDIAGRGVTRAGWFVLAAAVVGLALARRRRRT
jgi:hypothetical protein